MLTIHRQFYHQYFWSNTVRIFLQIIYFNLVIFPYILLHMWLVPRYIYKLSVLVTPILTPSRSDGPNLRRRSESSTHWTPFNQLTWHGRRSILVVVSLLSRSECHTTLLIVSIMYLLQTAIEDNENIFYDRYSSFCFYKQNCTTRIPTI